MGFLIVCKGADFSACAVDKVEIPTDPDCKHEYDNACDTTCNLCGATRTVTHNYVDGVCTICGAIDPSDIDNYPVQDGLKGLYGLGGTEEASLVNHAPEPHVNTADEALQGNFSMDEDYITFSEATNANRMLTYLRLPRDNGLTYIVLFRVPSGSRVLIGNRSGTDGTAGYGVNLLNTGVEFGGDSVLKAEDFTAINSDKNFAILAMTVNNGILRVVRYTNGALSEQYKFEGLINKWATGTSGNAVVIGGHGKPVNAKDSADISLTAIHEGVMTDEQLTEICAFVKAYGEHKGLTIE